MLHPIVRLMLVLLTVLGAVAPLRPVLAQDSDQDFSDAAATAVALSRLEAASDFNTLYDRIHPDAHAVVPRAAVIGWFQNEFAARGPGVSTVTGVRFVEWTWAVTGQTYPDTAEVSFRQPFADGTVLDDVVRLVQDRNGEWRWFFGRDRAFVEQQIAWYVTTAPPPSGPSAGPMMEVVSADLDVFWGTTFGPGPQSYVSPGVVAFSREVNTGCGTAESDIGPFYCSLDQAIYLPEGFMEAIESDYGDFAVATIIAHEWGHHIQYLRGFRSSEEPDEFGELYSLELELMADCYAGVWALDADTRGLLDPGDVEEAVVLSVNAGDAPGTARDDPSAHGSNAQRVKAFLDGYFDGISACEEDARGETRTTRTANGCELVELYPRYPGYQGYVTGLDGVGDHACLDDLEAQNAVFSRRDEDAANLAAGRRLGLEGPVTTWTWENWLAVEAERGMTPTCYYCALANANQRPEPVGTPVQYDDPRLLLGRIGEWNVLNRYTAERGLNYRNVPGVTDYQLRAISGLANPGRHLSATQLLATYDSTLDFLFGPGGFLNPDPLLPTLYDQGGYFPLPANASPADQEFALMLGVYGLEAGLAFFPQFLDRHDRLVTEWRAQGADGRLTDFLCAEGIAEAC